MLTTMTDARVFIFVFLFLFANVDCRRFETRCKLAREAIKAGLPNDIFLGNWVCLIEKVSNRDTAAFHVTPSGKKLYGLYQIPNKWCREGKKGGDCNVACESLLDDDIRDDTACAQLIFYREGFKYWSQWTIRCKNDDLITKEIYKCPDLSSRRSPESDITLVARLRRRLARREVLQSNLYTYYGINNWIR
ncbi:unnamed protein product [Diatraea saccharalis]|uniref:Lysozyme n=1 Tax=Diatraea saccharalis TaxID=40085 RepID=A0A9N9R9R1_9NEOP|nr:unnamed protein product [Diatraea saccharalis]